MTMKPEDIVLESDKSNANTEWCDDIEWAARDGQLPLGVWTRLANANRSLYAANSIAKMLAKDARGRENARVIADVSYSGMSPADRETLQLAMIELGDHAEEFLRQVREDDHGCCGNRRADA